MTVGAPQTPWVSKQVFIGFLWGGEAIGSLFVFMSLAIRMKTSRKLFVDDYLVMLSWVCSMACCIIWQMGVQGLYDQYKLTTGESRPMPEALERERGVLRGTVAFLWLYWTCLFGIKASFLVFFRRLDSHQEGFRKKWFWLVVTMNVLGYLTTAPVQPYQCLLWSLEYIFTQCSSKPAILWQHRLFIYQCVIDVVTDLLIITIPIIMLWNAALMSLFSLTIIVMGTSIKRVSVIPTANTQADPSWLYLWYNMEMTVTLLVSSLAAFRQLYVTQSPNTGYSRANFNTASSAFNRLFLNKQPRSYDLSVPQPAYQSEAEERDTVPLKSIH